MKMLATVFLAAALVGCAASPAPAPGTAPSDMSPEEHRAEADKHDHKAAEHDREADNAPGKGLQKPVHHRKADKEADIADQHESAAEKAE